MMNRRLVLSLFVGGFLAASAGLAQAQDAQDAPLPPLHAVHVGPGPEFEDQVQVGGIELLGFAGSHGGKVVTGAPFSGTATTETVQTLADGNHITRTTKTSLYRDSQGRFRKEVTLSGVGPLAASGTPKSFVVINDPVAGESVVLHPDTKVAMKSSHRFNKDLATAGREAKRQAREQEEIANGTLKREDLGTQTIAGVSAQGTRYTHTIPAGQIGNEKAISIVHETWYSNDLQMVVMSKASNPWSGDTTYTLSNIQRTEPASTLFTVPSDFTVKSGQGFMRVGPGPGGPGPGPEVRPLPDEN
jgi:hypothetical protein